MTNTRDCPHGRQVGKCADCDLVELYDVATELDMAKATISRLEAENEALRADAERYRWLRATTNFVTSKGERIDVRNKPELWDAAIDAARSKQ